MTHEYEPKQKVGGAGQYLRTKVMTATPEELRLMLFDGAIRFAGTARQGIVDSDHDKIFEGISRCQDILLELINSLRPEHDAELCNNLSALYTFLYTRLIDANSKRDTAILDEIIELLAYERETWRMLLEKLTETNREATRISDLPPGAGQDRATLPPHRDTGGIVGGTLSVQG